jgi:hypothetical protein
MLYPSRWIFVGLTMAACLAAEATAVPPARVCVRTQPSRNQARLYRLLKNSFFVSGHDVTGCRKTHC